MLTSAVLDPTSWSFASSSTIYGYGAFATVYGGAGESLSYTGRSTFSFAGLSGDGIYLDFLANQTANTTSLFNSLLLSVDLNGSTVYNQTFATLADAQTGLSGAYGLGNATGSDSVTFSYTFNSSTIGSGFGFDFLLADSQQPVAPPSTVPQPGTFLLLLSGILGLVGAAFARLRRSRTT